MIRLHAVLTGLVLLIGTSLAAYGVGDLSLRPAKLPDLVLGVDETGFAVSQKEYGVETGKAYQLKIVSTGKHEYALVAPELFDNIWLRKVEAGGVEIKANRIFELEFERPGEAEIFFVPIRPGSYRMQGKGMESKGLVITFNVK